MDDPNKSPWIHDWTDKQNKERYQFHVREQYETFKTYRDITFQNHVGYAKWLLASLLAVHGGSIYAISSIRESVRPEQLDALVTGAGWNLIGIGMTLLTGFCAWLNFQIAWVTYNNWADPSMLFNRDKHPATKNKKTDLVNATLYAGAGFGLISAYCFAASAVTVISALRLQA